MKKFILLLQVLTLVCAISFAQKPIQLYQENEILMYNTSEIDSIAHTSDGIIKVYLGGDSQEYSANQIDSVSISTNNDIIYEIPSDVLNEWDSGWMLSNQICLLNKVDTLNTENLAYYNLIEDDNEANGIAVKYNIEGKLVSIESNEESFYFSYDGNVIIVHSINREGVISEFSYTEEQTSLAKATRTSAAESNNNALVNSYENLQKFLNKYADKLANSDTPYLRNVAEDLRNLPENLMRDGIVKGLSKLFGKNFDLVDKILKYLEDNDKRRVAFGNCYVSLQGISESNEHKYIKGVLQGINELPNYGDHNIELKYGILGRYVGSGNDKSLPTTHWNDYKWEWSTSYQSVSSINISQELPKLSFGWYGFRSYEERFGIVKYCAYHWYFNPELEDVPEYTISNVQSRYVGDNKVEVSFTCSFNPIRTDILLYQGIELKTKEGEKITSFGSGIYTTTVKKIFDTSLFEKDYSNFVATMEIDAQFWYVPYAIGKTYYKDLEPRSVTYDQKPSITFTSVSVNSTEVTSYDEENDVTRYKTQYSFDCDIKGTFWFNTIQFQIYSDHWNNNWSSQTVSDDGSYTMTGYMTYGSNSSMNHTGFYQMYLHNGGTKSSSNSLIYGGVPGNPSISIGGTPAYAPARKVAKKDVTSNNEASSTFVNMKKI